MDDIPPVKKLNTQLLKVGRRICSKCGGNFEVSNFYVHGGWLSGICKGCADKAAIRRIKERYHKSKAYRDYQVEKMRRFRLEHPGYNAQKMKEQHEREKRKRFEVVLGTNLDD